MASKKIEEPHIMTIHIKMKPSGI